VTARKGTVPKGAVLSAEENLWFEEKALAELERLPTPAWEKMAALWNWIPLAHPATRQRILARCVELASKRGDPLSAKIAEHVICELAVSTDPRASVHDEDGLRAAARHLARNPRASLSELAAAAGIDGKKTTVRQWKARPDFQAFLNDEKYLVTLEQARHGRLVESERREYIRSRRAAKRSKKRSPKKVLMNG
jgi:hypothetical protein